MAGQGMFASRQSASVYYIIVLVAPSASQGIFFALGNVYSMAQHRVYVPIMSPITTGK